MKEREPTSPSLLPVGHNGPNVLLPVTFYLVLLWTPSLHQCHICVICRGQSHVTQGPPSPKLVKGLRDKTQIQDKVTMHPSMGAAAQGRMSQESFEQCLLREGPEVFLEEAERWRHGRKLSTQIWGWMKREDREGKKKGFPISFSCSSIEEIWVCELEHGKREAWGQDEGAHSPKCYPVGARDVLPSATAGAVCGDSDFRWDVASMVIERSSWSNSMKATGV